MSARHETWVTQHDIGSCNTARHMEGGTEACTCGCAIEAHGGDPEYPGSTSCTECACIAYEADLNTEET